MTHTKTQRRKLCALYKAEMALFRRSARTLRSQLTRLKQTEVRDRIDAFVDLVRKKAVAAERLRTLADQVPAVVQSQTRTAALFALPAFLTDGCAYQFITAGSEIKVSVADFDEHRVLLRAAVQLHPAIKAAQAAGDKDLETKLSRQTWLLSSAQNQVHSLCRQADALFATEWALFHGQDLHFWQGRRRWMRWYGDDRPLKYDCPTE